MILVTGARGHLGANLVRRLLGDGNAVRVFVHKYGNNAALEGLDVDRAYGDLREFPAVMAAVRRVERIYHCAAKLSIVRGAEREIFESNVVGTHNVVRAALEVGVSKVVVTGSLSAVGHESVKQS